MIEIAPTDLDWFNQLRNRPLDGAINCWSPTPCNVRQLKVGDLFYFLLTRGVRKIGGFGHFCSYENMRASQAWKQFGPNNGVANLQELVTRTGPTPKRTVWQAIEALIQR